MQIISNRNSHRRLLRAVLAHRSSRLQSNILKFPIPQILVQEIWRRIVRHINVRPPRIIKIRKDHAQSVISRRIAHSRAPRHFRKRPIAIVVKQRIARALQSARPALHIQSAVFAIRRFSKSGQIVQMKIHVIRHHQIQKSVAIVVAKRRARAPSSIRNARLFRHIRERSIAIVPVQNISAEASHVNVRPSIIFVIADGSAHRKTRRGNSRFVRHVRKCSVVIVVIERPSRLFAPDRHVNRRRIRKINIQPSVAIVIQQQHAAAHRFHNVFALRRRSVREFNSSSFRHINQLRNTFTRALKRFRAGRRWRGLRPRFLPRRQSGGQREHRK